MTLEPKDDGMMKWLAATVCLAWAGATLLICYALGLLVEALR